MSTIVDSYKAVRKGAAIRERSSMPTDEPNEPHGRLDESRLRLITGMLEGLYEILLDQGYPKSASHIRSALREILRDVKKGDGRQ